MWFNAPLRFTTIQKLIVQINVSTKLGYGKHLPFRLLNDREYVQVGGDCKFGILLPFVRVELDEIKIRREFSIISDTIR